MCYDQNAIELVRFWLQMTLRSDLDIYFSIFTRHSLVTALDSPSSKRYEFESRYLEKYVDFADRCTDVLFDHFILECSNHL